MVTFQGQEYMACWAPIPDAVVIVDEDGDGGFLPLSGSNRLGDQSCAAISSADVR